MPAYPHAGAPGTYEKDGPGMRKEVLHAAVIAVAVTLSGLLMGVLWGWLAPRVPVVGDVVDGRWVVYLKDGEGEQSAAIDGTFVLLGLVFGLVSAAAVFFARRLGGVPLVVGLAVGALLGSVVAWRLGVMLGPGQDVVARAREAGKGVTFSAPLKLNAKSALVVWPFVALAAHLGLTALFGPRDPEPQAGPGPYGPYGAGPGPYGGHGPNPGQGPYAGPGPRAGTGPYPGPEPYGKQGPDAGPGPYAGQGDQGHQGPGQTAPGSPERKDPGPRNQT